MFSIVFSLNLVEQQCFWSDLDQPVLFYIYIPAAQSDKVTRDFSFSVRADNFT